MATSRATSARKNPPSSVLSSSTVLDEVNISDSEVSNDSDAELSGVLESEEEQGEPSSVGAGNENVAETGNSTSSTSAISLLSVLKVPTPSDLTRKRKIQCNQAGKHKKTRPSSSIKSEPKGVKPQNRVKKYPNDSLSVSHGKLFCIACREELSLKSSSLVNHLKSQKHKDGKERLKRKEARERDIAKKLNNYNEETHMVSENIAEDTQVFRVKVVSAFLRAGVPLNKVELFRELFEETGYRLTDRRNIHDLIPFIHKEEFEKIQQEINGKDVSVIFDGTTRLGEALAIVIRYVNSDWMIVQRLVRLQLLVKSVTGEELARELISVLSVKYGISTDLLLAAMKDRATVNETASRTLKVVYPNLLSIGCLSHTIDRVGEHFNTPNLSEFIISWISLFSHSPKTRFLWLDQTGKSMATYSPTRWWSRWEVIEQVSVQFGDVLPFLRRDDLGSATTTAKLMTFFTDPQKRAQLEVELAAILDWGKPFVTATYALEGDGPLVLEAYEKIEIVRATICAGHIPNVNAVARRLCSSSDKSLLQRVFHPLHSRGSTGTNSNQALQQNIIHYATARVQPALDYFNKMFDSNLKDSLLAFKAARYFSPQRLKDIQPDAEAVNTVKAFPFLNSQAVLDGLKQELPIYLAKVIDLDPEIDILQWWHRNESELPCWAAAARKVLLVQPSSAASERVFSLLKSSFNCQQLSALQDYIEVSLMLQYNSH